jgi:hypothetical protein
MLACTAVSSLFVVTHQATRHGRPEFHRCNSGTPSEPVTQRHPVRHARRIPTATLASPNQTATVLPGCPSPPDQQTRVQIPDQLRSWINQIEIWFGIITRQAIRRGSLRSLAHLINRIDTYITHWNEDAEPFEWTATAGSILDKVAMLDRDYRRLVANNLK